MTPKRVHVLTAGFTSPNGRAFLMPLILHERALASSGISLKLFFDKSSDVTDCDILLVDSKYHSPRWALESDAVLAEFAELQSKVRGLIFVDILDSAGWDHVRMLPYVTLYCKAQLLRDRTEYLRPLYGYRIFSDYYHRFCGVTDDEPVWSEPVPDAELLNKMVVSWNSGLADYSWSGPYRMAAYQHLPCKWLLRFPQPNASPDRPRPQPLACRIGTRYLRNSVSFQRQELARRLRSRVETEKVSRRGYLSELRTSRAIISPFGLGEITLRDFEVFLAGALLLKPDMSAIETWPDVFRSGETMLSFRWDMSDLDEVIDAVESRPAHWREIARHGQDVYARHVSGPMAAELFTARFAELLRMCEARSAAVASPPTGKSG